MSLAPFSCLHCTPAHFTCVLTCVWACVPVQRMARDALCAPRVWDAAEPEVIHPRAFTDKRSLRLPSRSFGGVLLYFRPLERCAEQFVFQHPRRFFVIITDSSRARHTVHTSHASIYMIAPHRSRGRIQIALASPRASEAVGSASTGCSVVQITTYSSILYTYSWTKRGLYTRGGGAGCL